MGTGIHLPRLGYISKPLQGLADEADVDSDAEIHSVGEEGLGFRV